MSTIRRVYFYVVSVITLGIFAAGAQTLLGLVFALIKGTDLVEVGTQSYVSEQLSLGLAMLVIGGALWFLFWRAVRRQVAGNPVEIGAAIRKLFLNFILTVAALVSLYALAGFLRWLLDGAPLRQFPSGELAILIVTVAIWFYHWQVSEREGHPSPAAKTLRRWYIYILSGWGLLSLSISLVQLVNSAILQMPFWGEAIVSGGFWNSGVHNSIAWILPGGFAWVFHWFHMARDDSESTLRQVYLYLLAILGGAIAGLVALTYSLYDIFRFVFGGLGVTASTHFQFLSWTIPTILVAAAVWTYHQQVVREEAGRLQERLLSARRVLLYLMSFIGLGTLISGLIILLGILLGLLVIAAGREPTVVASGWWQGQLSVSLAMLLVAIPIWLYYWNRVIRMVAAGGMREWKARSRRIFLYVVLGAAIITLAADLVNIVYQLLNGLLQGTLGTAALRNSQWSLQSMVVAVPVLIYHWRILRREQRLGAEKAVSEKAVTLLAAETAATLASRIEERLGYQARRLRYLGQTPEDVPVLSDEEIDNLVSDIESAASDRVMLVIAGAKIMVLPYQEK